MRIGSTITAKQTRYESDVHMPIYIHTKREGAKSLLPPFPLASQFPLLFLPPSLSLSIYPSQFKLAQPRHIANAHNQNNFRANNIWEIKNKTRRNNLFYWLLGKGKFCHRELLLCSHSIYTSFALNPEQKKNVRLLPRREIHEPATRFQSIIVKEDVLARKEAARREANVESQPLAIYRWILCSRRWRFRHPEFVWHMYVQYDIARV